MNTQNTFDFKTIKSFEDACRHLGIEPSTVISQNDTIDEAAYKKLKVVVDAINNGWKPDWSDHDQYKYFPWFEVLSSGSGFAFSGYGYYYSASSVGSRLCFESREKCLYAAEQFQSIYEDFFIIK
jgi:hypothetical protein